MTKGSDDSCETPLSAVQGSRYDSFEFAGVHGAARMLLRLSREILTRFVISPVRAVRKDECCALIVLTDALYKRYVIHQLVSLPRSDIMSCIVVLKDGRKFLCSLDNGVYLTDVEGYDDGIPFGLDEIAAIGATRHFVSLKTMQRRSRMLDACGLLERMVAGNLSPGNYYAVSSVDSHHVAGSTP